MPNILPSLGFRAHPDKKFLLIEVQITKNFNENTCLFLSIIFFVSVTFDEHKFELISAVTCTHFCLTSTFDWERGRLAWGILESWSDLILSTHTSPADKKTWPLSESWNKRFDGVFHYLDYLWMCHFQDTFLQVPKEILQMMLVQSSNLDCFVIDFEQESDASGNENSFF